LKGLTYAWASEDPNKMPGVGKGVPPAIINILQGRAPPREFKLLEERYTVLTLETLRRYYEENAPKVAVRLSTCP